MSIDFRFSSYRKFSYGKIWKQLTGQLKATAKARDSYIVRLTGKPDQPRFTIIRSGS